MNHKSQHAMSTNGTNRLQRIVNNKQLQREFARVSRAEYHFHSHFQSYVQRKMDKFMAVWEIWLRCKVK